MRKIVVGFASFLIMVLWCASAAAWSHAGRFGGSISGGGGSWSAEGARGGSASGGGGSWSAEGFRGGSASGGGGSWSATDRWGGSASHTYGDPGASVTNRYGTSATVYRRPYYGGRYVGYHPPTVVDYHGSGCYNCGGWGAAAAGAAVGMATGAAIASANTSEDTSEAYSSGYAAGSAASSSTSTGYTMGAIYSKLPSGCAERKESGGTYYDCGTTWFSPSFGANGVYYRVVPPPS